MLPNTLQLIELKMTRLGFYLGLYLVPALLCLVQPGHWLAAVATVGFIPGLWRSLRRAQRRARLDVSEILLFSLTTALVAVVVAAVSSRRKVWRATMRWSRLFSRVAVWLLTVFTGDKRARTVV